MLEALLCTRACYHGECDQLSTQGVLNKHIGGSRPEPEASFTWILSFLICKTTSEVGKGIGEWNKINIA